MAPPGSYGEIYIHQDFTGTAQLWTISTFKGSIIEHDKFAWDVLREYRGNLPKEHNGFTYVHITVTISMRISLADVIGNIMVKVLCPKKSDFIVIVWRSWAFIGHMLGIYWECDDFYPLTHKIFGYT